MWSFWLLWAYAHAHAQTTTEIVDSIFLSVATCDFYHNGLDTTCSYVLHRWINIKHWKKLLICKLKKTFAYLRKLALYTLLRKKPMRRFLLLKKLRNILNLSSKFYDKINIISINAVNVSGFRSFNEFMKADLVENGNIYLSLLMLFTDILWKCLFTEWANWKNL